MHSSEFVRGVRLCVAASAFVLVATHALKSVAETAANPVAVASRSPVFPPPPAVVHAIAQARSVCAAWLGTPSVQEPQRSPSADPDQAEDMCTFVTNPVGQRWSYGWEGVALLLFALIPTSLFLGIIWFGVQRGYWWTRLLVHRAALPRRRWS